MDEDRIWVVCEASESMSLLCIHVGKSQGRGGVQYHSIIAQLMHMLKHLRGFRQDVLIFFALFAHDCRPRSNARGQRAAVAEGPLTPNLGRPLASL